MTTHINKRMAVLTFFGHKLKQLRPVTENPLLARYSCKIEVQHGTWHVHMDYTPEYEAPHGSRMLCPGVWTAKCVDFEAKGPTPEEALKSLELGVELLLSDLQALVKGPK